MKGLIETSVYLVVMALIPLIGIAFVSMNMGISQVNEVEQYVEEYIEIYGEYESKTEKYAYYKIHVTYSLRSRIFSLGRTHSYDGLVRVELGLCH